VGVYFEDFEVWAGHFGGTERVDWRARRDRRVAIWRVGGVMMRKIRRSGAEMLRR
jgi:hypothetical protein